MKFISVKTVIILFTLCILTMQSRAKEIIVSADKVKIEIVIGTTQKFTGVALDIDLSKSLPEGIEIDYQYFETHKDQLPAFSINNSETNLSYSLDKNKFHAGRLIIQFSDGNNDFISLLSNATNYLSADNPVKIKLTNDDYLVIAPEVLKEASLSKLFLSENQKEKLVAARGGAHTLYQNKFDISMKADQSDSTKKVFNIDFSYYGVPVKSVDWWNLAIKGTVSTDKNDPVSEIHFFPLTVGTVFGLEEGNAFTTGEVRGYAGIEGNQTFRESRINVSAYYSTIIPNFVDLTYGSPNRLRLKPVIKMGAEYWQEINDNNNVIDNQSAFKLGGEIYYYIPILEKYSLLVEGAFGYIIGDKFKQKYKADDVINKFDFTFGYEVPSAQLRVIAKYSFGQNDITFTDDTRLLIGVAMDFFNIINGFIK